MKTHTLLLSGIAALFLATGTAAQSREGCTQALAPLSTKPLTPKQFRAYKELRSIGITKKDAARVVRDPGVKKGEWGWIGDGENVKCVKNEEGAREGAHPEELMKYRNNVVIE